MAPLNGNRSSMVTDVSRPNFAASRARREVQSRRHYHRRITNNAPTIVAPTSPPQLSDLAFNIHGWALEDGMAMYGNGRGVYEVINAYKATMVKGGFDAKIQELRKESTGDIYRTDLTYTSRELDSSLAATDPAIAQYLVVGYTLQEEDPVFQANKSFARYSENELVGENRPSNNNLISWHEIRTPILVVTPIKENTGTSVRLFGLIMPRSDLCQPVLLTHERIFYRWEFRASAGARATQRNKYWNQVVIDKARELMSPEMIQKLEDERNAVKIRGHSIKLEGEDMLGSNHPQVCLDDSAFMTMSLDLDKLFSSDSKGLMLQPAQNGLDLNTDVKLFLTPEIKAIIQAIQISPNPSRLRSQLWHFIHRSNINLTLPPVDNMVLHDFFMLANPLDMDEVEVLSDEVVRAWPYLYDLVNPNALLHLKHVMVQTGQTITSRALMENFFKFTLSAFKMNPSMSDHEVSHWLTASIDMAQVLSSDPVIQQSLMVGLDADAVFMLLFLRELLVIHRYQQSLKSSMLQIPTMTKAQMTYQLEIRFEGHNEGSLFDVAEYLRGGFGVDGLTGMKSNMNEIAAWFEALRAEIRGYGRAGA